MIDENHCLNCGKVCKKHKLTCSKNCEKILRKTVVKTFYEKLDEGKTK
jgi:predicted nucleic acid-binding Zn ribbon protein